MIHLDTSALIAALTGQRLAAPVLRSFIYDGIRLGICTLVLYEWLRGPRRPDEIAAQEVIVPGADAVPFGIDEATIAAGLYQKARRPRGREIDLAIAACAMARGAALWTMNPRDFRNIPGLTLAER
jgi:predicted nucleic acid-binding protein